MNGRTAAWTVVAALAACGLAGCGRETPKAGPSTGGKASNPLVVIETSMGEIRMELYPEQSPITVENFLRYVNEGYYDGTIFHRVISSFMVQGGGFTPDLKQREPTHDTIRCESDNGLSNVRGTVAMARTNDPNSARAQFFINVVDNDFLDRDKARDGFGYTVFGKVTGAKSMAVVDEIKMVKVGERDSPTAGRLKDCPLKTVLIRSIRRLKEQR